MKGFKSIHKDGISHRDIKLENILLDSKFNPKISDFGFAVEYSKTLKGNLGTKIFKAPELKGIYDGYAIDIFSLGITLLYLTYFVPVFEDASYNSKLYNLLKSKNKILINIFWQFQEKYDNNIKKISDDLKDLFYKMVEFNPKKRIKIDEILNHKWFGEIRNMNEKELEKYEEVIKLKKEFIRRKKIVDEKVKDEIKKNIEESNKEYMATRSIPESENDYFKYDFKLKLIDKRKYVNYFININGGLNPRKFMNLLCDKIQGEFKDCFIEVIKDDDKAKIEVTFEEDLISEDFKKQFKEFGIEFEENEETQKEIVLRIKLYRTYDGYLIRFVNKKGDKSDFIDKYEKISNLVKQIFL